MYDRGVGLSTHSDSELITQTLCLDPPRGRGGRPDWPGRIKHLMALTPMAYSLLIMDNDRVYGVRDPYGNRPLCLGKVVPEGQSTDPRQVFDYLHGMFTFLNLFMLCRRGGAWPGIRR